MFIEISSSCKRIQPLYNRGKIDIMTEVIVHPDLKLEALMRPLVDAGRKGIWPSTLPEWDPFVQFLKEKRRAIGIFICQDKKSSSSLSVEIIYRHRDAYTPDSSEIVHGKYESQATYWNTALYFMSLK